MNLAPEQERLAREIVRRGRRRGASPMEIESAIETGLVESGLRNLRYGDADSQGWRQERASLYKDPTNLAASIERYYDETAAARKRRKYTRSGDLAADVQRPREDLRGKYEQRDSDADAILRRIAGDMTSSASGGRSTSRSRTVTDTTVDTAGLGRARGEAALGRLFAQRRPQGLLSRIGALRTTDPTPDEFTTRTQRTVTAPQSPAPANRGTNPVRGASRPSSQLLELFHDPIGGIKRGKEIGAIGGHGGHVHTGSGPKQLKALKKLAVNMGLTITSEAEGHPGDGVHTPTSLHYKGKAFDASGPPDRMADYTRRVKRMYGV